MVVIIKRKYVKPPEKYDKEPTVEDLDEFSIRGYDPPADFDQNTDEVGSLTSTSQGDTNAEEHSHGKNLPIYPTAWGWNSEGRAGNITADEVHEPRYTQHSAGQRYIACAAGSRHSLLVSDDGSVYSFGDGRKGQLGYGNPFFDKPPKGGIVQVFPRLVNPSGCCKYNRDIKVTEVACGESFSIAREGSQEDGVALCPGLRALEDALMEVKKFYPDCHTVQYAWAQARQERAIISRSFEGKLVAWGTGQYGELGMGQYHKTTTYPQIIPKLDFVSIVKVTAGAHHVLAISSEGALYSWGRGKSGRLGHKDNRDQYYPKVVQYFLYYKVETCSAGDAHSAVIMTKRKVNRDGSYTRYMACFGRGAHGRLGVGHNRSISFPEIVSKWPPSFTRDYTLLQVACGGAHTLALAYRNVKKCLANPYGVETAVYAWGFGTNGQLGVGDNLKDSFLPVRVKMPKWELVCEVSAGRSWSLARTIAGELYSWGKGLRGQLGHGKRAFCITPRKVDTFASFLALSSGYSHNVTITTTKKIISTKNAEGFIDDITRSHSTPGEDSINVFTAAKRRVHMRLANHKSLSMRSFNCCKRDLPAHKAKIRVTCITCNLSEVCILCVKFCHRGHKLVERQFSDLRGMTFCQCGVFHKCCKVLPPILECNQESPRPDNEIDDLDTTEETGERPIVHTEHILKAVRSLQVLARSYIGKKQIRRMMKYIKYVRRTACENYVNDVLMTTISVKFNRSYEFYRVDRELMDMAVEDEARKMYDFYHNLQVGLLGMDFMLEGLKVLQQKTCALIPTQEDTLNLTDRSSEVKTLKLATVPSFMYSHYTMKMIERLKHPTQRLPIAAIARLTRRFPRFDSREGQYFDPDVALLTNRYVRTFEKEKKYNKIMKEFNDNVKEIKAAMEASAGKKKSGNNSFKTSTVVARPTVGSPSKPAPPPTGGRAVPPRGSPGPSMVAAGRPPPPNASGGVAAGKNSKYMSANLKQASLEPPKPTTIQGAVKLKERQLNHLHRRHSIAAPEKMYSRVTEMRPNLTRRTAFQRRNSLPANISMLRGDVAPDWSFAESISNSLDMFYTRQIVMEEFLLKDYAYVWKKVPPKTKKHKMHVALKYAWLNPRLPVEMRHLVVGQGTPARRHSIGEPERLNRQVQVQCETRNTLLALRKRATREKIPVRRRSFDFGEVQDGDDLINSILGYVFEEDFQPPTLMQVRADNVKMERILMETVFREVDIEAQLKIDRPEEDGAAVYMEYFDDSGYPYYYNPATGETMWEPPQGWNVHLLTQYQDTHSGEWYWYNNTTGESTPM